MKICIVTVYNELNSGSFWQAIALKSSLEKLGNKVVFLKRKSIKIEVIKIILKKIMKGKFKEIRTQFNIFKEFRNIQKTTFETIANKKKYFKDIDYFILGSDTIWNLETKYFLRNYKKYFGGIFKGKKVFSYAASVGNTTLKTIKKHKDIPLMLNKMVDISVRDEPTYNIVKEISNRNVKIVCDPTLLLSKEDYQKIEPIPKENNYIFLYLFSRLSDNQIKQLKNFANKNHLKIINGVNQYKYVDKNIINSPNAFLNYMLYANYIITDTFHGTIFSANLEKNFIVINKNKKKVNDFINRLEILQDRLINEDDLIEEKFLTEINYTDCRKKILEFMRK